MSDDFVRLPTVDLGDYKVPDFSRAVGPTARGVSDSDEVFEYSVAERKYVPVKSVSAFDDNRLVFADREHERKYDEEYASFLASLGEQVEPETVDKVDASTGLSIPVEYDKIFGLVGQGEVTGPHCGQFVKFMACFQLANHNFSTLAGGNFAGKGDVHPIYSHCCRPSCPICYSKGWAMREANIITQRMQAVEFGYVDVSGKKHVPLGRAEHVIISIPPSDYGLSYEQLKAKVLKVALSRGIIGGVMIWHPKRYRKFDVVRGGIRNMRGWFYAPHWHIIGYFASDVNYSKCRKCPKMKSYEKVTGSGRVVQCIGNVDVCRGCSGFEAKVRVLAWGSNMKPNVDGSTGSWVDAKGKEHLGDKYIVKVQEYRKSIFATASYQLNHAGYMIGAKRFSPETWFGSMSYRKLSVTIERKKSLCRICNNELLPHLYVGHELNERFEGLPMSPEIVNLVEFDSEGKSIVAWEIDKAVLDKPVFYSGA